MVNRQDRAKQFMPFDGLKGFKEEIKKRERIKVKKKEFFEEEAKILSEKLSSLKKGELVEIIHFSIDEYIKTKGIITKISKEEKYLVIVKTQIYFDNIIEINY